MKKLIALVITIGILVASFSAVYAIDPPDPKIAPPIVIQIDPPDPK